MTARDIGHAYDIGHACRHMYRHVALCPICTPSCEHISILDRIDGQVCLCDQPDGTSWDGSHRTPIVTPWWRSSDGELSWPAVLLILAVTAAAVMVALVVGQRWQDQRCAAAASTSTPCIAYGPSDTAQQRETP